MTRGELYAALQAQARVRTARRRRSPACARHLAASRALAEEGLADHLDLVGLPPGPQDTSHEG